MNETDHALLERFRQARDADAFAEIIARHQNLVYSTCLRVLGNQADAQDAAQDCFLRLLRKAGTVQASLGGWLHRCAIDISIDELRSRESRRNREEVSTQMNSHSNPDPSWDELAPHLDAAINDLPDDLRHAVVEHFLERRTQADIAKELGVSAMTISRRVDAGIEDLRKNLKKAGVIASAGALALLLTENAVQAAPAALTASLSKLTVLAAAEPGGLVTTPGAVSGATGAAAAGGQLKLIALVAAAVLAGVGIWKLAAKPEKAEQPDPAQQAPAPAQVAAQPIAQDTQDPQQWKPFELTMEYPADAMMIIWIPSIRKAAEGYVDLLGDLLDEGDGMSAIWERLDEAGLPPEAIGGPAIMVGVLVNRSPVVLIPVEDMQALIAKMEAGPDADGIYGRLPSNINGTPVPGKYRVNLLPWKDGYAAFSSDRQVLKSFAEAPQKKRHVNLEERVDVFCYWNVPAILKAFGQQGEAGTTANLPLKLASEVEGVDLALKCEDGLRISSQVAVKPGGMLSQYLVPSPGLQGLEPALPVLDSTTVALWMRTAKASDLLFYLIGAAQAGSTAVYQAPVPQSFFDAFRILRNAYSKDGGVAFGLEIPANLDWVGAFELDKPDEFTARVASQVDDFNDGARKSENPFPLVHEAGVGTIGRPPNPIAKMSRIRFTQVDNIRINYAIQGKSLILAPSASGFGKAMAALNGQAQPIAWNAVPPGNNAVIIFDLVPLVREIYGKYPPELQFPKDARGWIALKAKEGNALGVEAFISREAVQLLAGIADGSGPAHNGECITRLWRIGNVWQEYRKGPNGQRFPESLREFVPRHLREEELLCPLTNAPYATIFDLLDHPVEIKPDMKLDELMLVWDNEPHLGRNVLYADGHRVWMRENIFTDELKNLMEFLKKE